MSFHVEDSTIAMTRINCDLLRIRNWCFDNCLLLNPNKTKLIVFGSRQMMKKIPDFKLSLLQKELIPAEFVKDLGVMFDSNLSFDKHILATVSSCMSKLGQISRAKHAFSKDLLVKIINTLVFSKLFYCSSVWSNTSNSNIRKLQKFAASGRRKFDHITPVLNELRWLPVKTQLYYRDATLAFKCMMGCAPSYLASQFITRGDVTGRKTRNSAV